MALAALLLAACGSTPKHVVETSADAGRPAAKSATKKPSVVQKRGGGYYKDDGPAEELPDGLDELSDAEPKLEPLHRFANRPYVVFGKEYVPNTSIKPYKARGIGSWYGKKFHGQKTSIGEPYDMFAMTAAHPTLAIPSYVRVTSVANGRSVIVRVIDRGPFHADRVIDLSYAAAHKLDYIRNGSSLVEVEAIVPEATGMTYGQVAAAENRPPPARNEIADVAKKLAAEEKPVQTATTIGLNGSNSNAMAAGGVLLQLGAFANADNAETMRQRLTRELDWADGELRININGGIHRLHLGPYPNRADAERVAERIRQEHGFKPTFVIR
ncbi:MAG: septal ring lytic transglycosylase RlpA family protein [Betaproteobacteria bacterium]|uniref:Endolytic peptidoglycan transglycosylase RlpA n=1 Tax=Candidatus Proximibacter danicus TaxID=2954365 RepID=A0A9D7K2I0_9PROT|nr:septal ring lytic transglycosylase RlpA family protein [Candidatus Proximibacter danicus]